MKNMMMKVVAKAALKTAESGKVKHSTILTYQPKMPKELLDTKK